jgi:hypothetical protein
VPAGVGVLERVKPHVRIAMVVQRIARLRNERVRREEVAQRRLLPLAGENKSSSLLSNDAPPLLGDSQNKLHHDQSS